MSSGTRNHTRFAESEHCAHNHHPTLGEQLPKQPASAASVGSFLESELVVTIKEGIEHQPEGGENNLLGGRNNKTKKKHRGRTVCSVGSVSYASQACDVKQQGE